MRVVSPRGLLGRVLKELLRHRAVEMGVAISADGWARLEDVLPLVNTRRLWDMARVTTPQQLHFTEDDVRAAVSQNEKRRFELSEDGHQIRAVQGHTIPGIECGDDPLCHSVSREARSS